MLRDVAVSSRQTSREALIGAAEELLARRDELAGQIADAVLARVPYYAAVGNAGAARVRASVLPDITLMFERVRDGREGAPPDVSESLARGRACAAHGVPLAELLKAHRIGGRMMWQAFAEEADSAALEASEISQAATLMWEVHDLCTQATAEGFAQEASERLLADHERRSALLDLLLRGPLADRRALSLLASGLRLPTDGPYLAIVTEAPDAGINPMPDIEVQLRAHGHASAWQLLPEALVGIVHLPNGRADILHTRLAGYPAQHHGLSPAFADLALASSAVRMARIALVSTRATREHIGIFDEQPVIMAATGDPDVMRHIRQTVLRGLDSMPEDERAVLLDTLETWLDTGGSTDAAAAALFCHPNTIRHRLRRLETATGRRLRTPRDVARSLSSSVRRFAVEISERRRPPSAC
jgi:PucR C-terminal helix-turn-helix domain